MKKKPIAKKPALKDAHNKVEAALNQLVLRQLTGRELRIVSGGATAKTI